MMGPVGLQVPKEVYSPPLAGRITTLLHLGMKPKFPALCQLWSPSDLTQMEVQVDIHLSADVITFQGPTAPIGDMGMSLNTDLPSSSVSDMGMSLNGAEDVSH